MKEGTWVCVTPEAYDQALAEQAKTNGYKELMALKDRLLAEKSCMFVDDEDIEDMMAPFVEVVDRQGDKIKVTFTIEFYKKDVDHRGGIQPGQIRRLDGRGPLGRLSPGRGLIRQPRPRVPLGVPAGDRAKAVVRAGRRYSAACSTSFGLFCGLR